MTDRGVRPAEVVIGLDVGTTRVKAVAFGVDRPRQVVAVRDQHMLAPRPGWQVQDPTAVVDAVRGALRDCVEQLDGASVAAVSVAAALHGLIGLDDRMRPVTQLVTWADARAVAEASELRGRDGGADLHRATGTPVHPMSPLVKLRWFAAHEPETVEAVRWWIGLKDWVLLWLTGRLVTERSTASATGLFDLRSNTWNTGALDAARITARVLPEVAATTATLPLAADAATEVGLPRGTVVVLGAGDGPLANVGTGALTPGVAALSVGTSAALRVVVDEPGIDVAGTLFCYSLDDATWVTGGAVSNGGSVAAWASAALAPDLDGPGAILDLAARVTPGCDGLVMLPYLVAERSPLWDATMTGAYLGLRAEHTRAHLARAAIEGVGLQLRGLLAQLTEMVPVTSVRATGGALGSPLWRDVIAGALECPVHVVEGVEGTALGAAALGLVALGGAASLGEAVEALYDVDAAAGDPLPVDPAVRDVFHGLGARLTNELARLGSLASRLAR